MISQEGCRLAFGEIMRAMGAVPPADLAGRPFHDHDGAAPRPSPA
jgi:alginate O-acetyltransferase complex protein AlgJ